MYADTIRSSQYFIYLRHLEVRKIMVVGQAIYDQREVNLHHCFLAASSADLAKIVVMVDPYFPINFQRQGRLWLFDHGS